MTAYLQGQSSWESRGWGGYAEEFSGFLQPAFPNSTATASLKTCKQNICINSFIAIMHHWGYASQGSSGVALPMCLGELCKHS